MSEFGATWFGVCIYQIEYIAIKILGSLLGIFVEESHEYIHLKGMIFTLHVPLQSLYRTTDGTMHLTN